MVYSTKVCLGYQDISSIIVHTCQLLTNSPTLNLNDVTLADEDSNSMLDGKAVMEEHICFVKEKEKEEYIWRNKMSLWRTHRRNCEDRASILDSEFAISPKT